MKHPLPSDPESLRWSAGSKIADPEGRPLVMYHGTSREFDRFEVSPIDGAYFSSDAAYALGYAEVKADLHPGGRPVLMAVLLQMRNPLVLDPGNEVEWQRYTERGFRPDELRAQGYDGVMMRYPDNGEVEAMVLSPDQIRRVQPPSLSIPPLSPPRVEPAKPVAPVGPGVSLD